MHFLSFQRFSEQGGGRDESLTAHVLQEHCIQKADLRCLLACHEEGPSIAVVAESKTYNMGIKGK